MMSIRVLFNALGALLLTVLLCLVMTALFQQKRDTHLHTDFSKVLESKPFLFTVDTAPTEHPTLVQPPESPKKPAAIPKMSLIESLIDDMAFSLTIDSNQQNVAFDPRAIAVEQSRGDTVDTTVEKMEESGEVALSGASFTPEEYLPIYKATPRYPAQALRRKIEGFVVLEYTVTKKGTVTDVRVTESKPQRVFDKAAIQSARQYRYKPRLVKGLAVEVPGVRTKINFELR